MTKPKPLVSVLCASSRPAFLPQLERCFARQTYQPVELIIEDGSASMGAKLNRAAERARGAFFVKWDDDDWYSPEFLALAVSRGRGALDAISAWAEFLVWFPETRQFRTSGGNWMAGGTLCFPRGLWEKKPFREDLARGVDAAFLGDHAKARRLPIPGAERHYVVIRHGANTWNDHKPTGQPVNSFFARQPVYPVEQRAIWKDPADLAFYRGLVMRGVKVLA